LWAGCENGLRRLHGPPRAMASHAGLVGCSLVGHCYDYGTETHAPLLQRWCVYKSTELCRRWRCALRIIAAMLSLGISCEHSRRPASAPRPKTKKKKHYNTMRPSCCRRSWCACAQRRTAARAPLKKRKKKKLFAAHRTRTALLQLAAGSTEQLRRPARLPRSPCSTSASRCDWLRRCPFYKRVLISCRPAAETVSHSVTNLAAPRTGRAISRK